MSVFWLATRATGELSLVLLTAVVVLGIATARGWAHERWPEAVVTLLHRNVSLLSVVFLAVHIGTTVLDGFVPIGWIDVVIPFAQSYRTLWVGLGTVAFDLLVTVIVTSLLRHRIAPRAWKLVHLLSYVLWAVAIVHGLGAGTDRVLTRAVAAAMVMIVLITLAVRALTPHRADDPSVSVARTRVPR